DVTVAAGTVIDTQLQTAVATNTNKVGDNVNLQTTESVIVNGVVAIPVGSTVHGTVTELRAAGRIKGASVLTLRFTDVEFSNGRRFPMTCEAFHVEEKGDGKETAAEIGGGSAVGGVLGSVIGGKHSTVKGAAIGAAVGTVVAGATKGTQIQLPVGKSIQVQL